MRLGPLCYLVSVSIWSRMASRLAWRRSVVISRANSAALSALVVEQTCGGARRLRDGLLESPVKYSRPRCVLRRSDGTPCGKGALVDCRSGVLDVLVGMSRLRLRLPWFSRSSRDRTTLLGPPLKLRLRPVIERSPTNGDQYTKEIFVSEIVYNARCL